MNTNQISPKRNFTNTVAAGLKSFSGKGKTFYVLEFKNNSQLHKASSTKEIIVDYIELGRNPKCQVRFGEDCRTVSGVHCAIMREGDQYFVKHLSKINPTLINGKPVADKWYLSSGDELMLSYGGPVIGFIVPANNFTSSIPLTRRLNLFREQALRPYKRAIAFLALILMLSIGVSAYLNIKNANNLSAAKKKIEKLIQGIDSLESKNEASKEEINKIKAEASANKNIITGLKHQLSNLGKFQGGRTGEDPPPPPSTLNNLSQLYPSVFYIRATKVVFEYNNEVFEYDGGWFGTAFLLKDGRFITARHVIEPWFFINGDSEKSFKVANLIVTNNGKITVTFNAISSNGMEFELTSDDFQFDRSNDKLYKETMDEGEEYLITIAPFHTDWAVASPGRNGQLISNRQLSNNLPAGTGLFTLGFPYGYGVNQQGVEPRYSDFTVSSAGIDNNGFINISGRSFDTGNSGGPVLVKTNNGYEVVGIVSAGRGSQGIIIPISRIY